MRARIRAQYHVEVDDELSHIVALPNNQAALLSTYSRKVFVISDDALKQIDLRDHCIFEHREAADLRLRGALFPYKTGFGIIYADMIHLWEHIRDDPRTIPISNPIQPDNFHRPLVPLAASYVPQRYELVVVLNDYWSAWIPELVGTVVFDKPRAFWLDSPRPLNHEDFRELEVAGQFDPTRSYKPVVNDILATEECDLLIHSVGRYRRYRTSGMDYSALAAVDNHNGWHAHLLQTVIDGLGNFSSDRQHLMVFHLRGKPAISFYDLQGMYQATLRLTPKRVLGRIQTGSWIVYNRHGNLFWLADDHGEVTCCELRPD
jgi:hypothetical protein